MDLLILELGSDVKADLRMVETIVRKGKVANVFLTGGNLDANVLLQAMRIGVKEFFPQPLDEKEVMASLSRLVKDSHQKKSGAGAQKGKIVSLIGTKGGVGTTTLAVNMAACLAAKGKGFDTALVDMHVILGEIPLFFDIKPGFHWGEILKNIHRLDATLLDNVLTHHRSGVHILPSPASLDPGAHPITSDVIERLLETMRDTYNYIIIDTSFVMGASLAKILEMSDLYYVVAMLTLPSLANTAKVIKTIEALSPGAVDEKLRVVVNRYHRKATISLQDAEKGIDRKIFWRVPEDHKPAANAINQGKPLNQVAPRAALTRSMEGLAESVAVNPDKVSARHKKWKLF